MCEDRQNWEDAVQPNLKRARRAALVAHEVVIKLKESGIPIELDTQLGALSADLGDLYGAQEELVERLERLTHSPKDWDAIGDCLVDLKMTINHISVHAKSVQQPITEITNFAYQNT